MKRYICKLQGYPNISFYRLKMKINDIQSESNKMDDALDAYRNHKKFLDQVMEFKSMEKIDDPEVEKMATEPVDIPDQDPQPDDDPMFFITGQKEADPNPQAEDNTMSPLHPDIRPVPISRSKLLSLFTEIEEDNLFIMN